MFDLDGVVYVDGHAVEHAAESIAAARDSGGHVAFITNNPSRSPERVATNLRELGVQADAHDVVTSAQAAARLLVRDHGEGAPVAVLGAEGLVVALREAGLGPVEVGDPRAVAVVSGYAPEVRWRVIMRAATLIRGGLPWVATNTDLTLPLDDGLAPGHGALVRLISEFAQVTPQVAGKPRRPLLDETRLRVGGRRPLMIGDRLDTDIAGAHEAGCDSMLVMTGVTGLAELVAAEPGERPTWIARDLTGLTRPGQQAREEPGGGAWTAGSWTVRSEGGRLLVGGSGGGEGADADAWLTAVAAAAWAHLDSTGRPAQVGGLVEPPGQTTRRGSLPA
jgi:HAD superfamily hydrolase (TIGR01450 family)